MTGQKSSAATLSSWINGYRHTALIYAALKLQLPDVLGSRAVDYVRLAGEMRCSAHHLRRLLNALVVLEICEESSPGIYRLTETGSLLMATANCSDREMALLAVDQYANAWFNLEHSVRSGEAAFEHLYGCGPFDWRKQNADASQIFNRWLAKETRCVMQSIVEKFDLSGINSIMDIGGGHGGLLLSLLEKKPVLYGTLFDQEHVVAEVENIFKGNSRMTAVAGDFFKEVPLVKVDCLVLKSVLHDWESRDVVTILKNCRKSMEKSTKLVIIERLLPDIFSDHYSSDAKNTLMLDMHMMAVTGGMERTVDEYRNLLSESDLELVNVIPTDSGFFLMEAVIL